MPIYSRSTQVLACTLTRTAARRATLADEAATALIVQERHASATVTGDDGSSRFAALRARIATRAAAQDVALRAAHSGEATLDAVGVEDVLALRAAPLGEATSDTGGVADVATYAALRAAPSGEATPAAAPAAAATSGAF